MLGQTREYRPIMIAVSGDHVAPPRLHGKAMLLHQPHDLLVVHDDPVLTQLRRYAPVPISRKFGANFGNLPDEQSLLDRLALGLIVVGRPCAFAATPGHSIRTSGLSGFTAEVSADQGDELPAPHLITSSV